MNTFSPPQEKATILVLFCMTIVPDFEKARTMAKKIAKEMPSFAETMLHFIDNLPK
jgi:isocitrate lyase